MTLIQYGDLTSLHAGLKITIKVDGDSATGMLTKVSHEGNINHFGSLTASKIRTHMDKEVLVTVGEFGTHSFHPSDYAEVHDKDVAA